MNKITIIAISLIVVIVGTAIVSWFVWLSYPKIRINIMVTDKTVRDLKRNDHKALFWVLNNARVCYQNGRSYSLKNNYYGFFPLQPLNEREYNIKKMALENIDSLSDYYDAAYYADVKGVYFNEWFRGFRNTENNSVIDGGINQVDFSFLKLMHNKNKLLIAEYFFLGPPTSELIRYKTEELFGVHYTGWVGKYFNSLDTTDLIDIPNSYLKTYKQQNGGTWPYNGEGIIFLGTMNRMIVLDKEKLGQFTQPVIVTNAAEALKYNLPDEIYYTGWFEVVNADSTNSIISKYRIPANGSGIELLTQNGLKEEFMAVSLKGDKTYYFAGDFAKSNVQLLFSRMANARKVLHYFANNPQKVFFYNYYFSLIESIIKQNYVKK